LSNWSDYEQKNPELNLDNARTKNIIELFNRYKPKKANEKPKTVAEELGDTLFSIICVANHYSVDLGAALEGVIEKYSVRDQTRFKK